MLDVACCLIHRLRITCEYNKLVTQALIPVDDLWKSHLIGT